MAKPVKVVKVNISFSNGEAQKIDEYLESSGMKLATLVRLLLFAHVQQEQKAEKH